MTTRKTVLQDIADELEWPYGDISSGTATTAVLDGLVGAHVDDEFNSDRLMMPDAANTTDQERIITDWTGSSGTATWSGNRTDTTYTNETFIISPSAEFTLRQLRDAADTTCRRTKRTVRVVIPTLEDELEYPLRALDWLRSDEDVDAVRYRDSPNFLDNEGFTKWQSGTASAPDGFTLSGSGGTVARTTSFAIEQYAAQLTRSSNDVYLTYALPWALVMQLRGHTVHIGAWVESDTASRAQIKVDDGVSTATALNTVTDYSEWVTTSLTVADSATKLEVSFAVVTGDTSAICSRIVACEDSIPDDLKDHGSDAYVEHHLTHHRRNVGGFPVVTLGSAKSRRGQLIVWTRRPYAEFTSDADATDCPRSVLLNGALYHLFSAHRKGQDRERPDRNAQMYGQAYRDQADALIDLPPPEPLTQYVVHGA